jgi:dipeptide transport system substrate-binding protein
MHILPLLAGFTLALAPLFSLANPLVICTEASPEGFDVVRYNSLVTTNAAADTVFNRLVEYNTTQQKILPSLAERWEISKDGLVYTFYLRKQVAFHRHADFKASRPFNANDVLFTFSRMIDPSKPWFKNTPAGFPHAQAFSLNKRIKSISKVDNNTVRFTLHAPDATFLSLLSMGFASIYSEEYANQLLASGKTALLNNQPIGTGPFIFRRYQKDSVVRFEANPTYFGGKPPVDQLIYVITPDAALRTQKIKAGECHIALSPKPQDVQSVKHNKAIQILHTPAFMTAFIALNTQHTPLNNKQVRQALNMALDKKAYLKVVFNDTATPAVGPYPPNTWSYTPATDYPYDPVKAKALLAQAGFPHGFNTSIWTRPSGSVLNPNPKAAAELLQADLAKIGVNAKINVLEWGELIQKGKAGAHDLLFMGWSGDNGDPDNFLTPQFSCAAVTSGTNFARYCDPRLDKAIAEGKRSANTATRTAHYAQAQKIIHDEALWIPLAHPTASVLIRANVTGYTVNPFGRQDFSKVVIR